MLDIKSKSSESKELNIKKINSAFYIISLVLGIIAGITTMAVFKENRLLILISEVLVYMNIVLFIKILLNDFRTMSLWKVISEIVLEIETKKYSIEEVQKRWLEDRDFKAIMGKQYGKTIEGINAIINKIKKSIENTDINERMNIDLVKNLTRKLDKPLNDIMDNIDKLKSNEVDNTVILGNLKNKSERLKNLIEELFEVSKLASGDMKVDLDTVEIVALMKQAIIEFKDEAQDNNIMLKVKLPNEKVFINANGEKLWRVFEILIHNTIKHSLENSRVYIEITEKEGLVNISLKNTSKKELNINAQELISLINSNEEEEASGLGIEIAKNLVLIQNGSLNIDIEADLFKIDIDFNSINTSIEKVVQ